MPVNKDGRAAIENLITWHREKYNATHGSRPLFPSRHQSGTVQMHRQTAHQMLKKAFIAAGLNGKITTHSLRKSFAQRVYEQSGDIYLVKELLGHRNVATTQAYLGVNYADACDAVEAISLASESYRILLYNSITDIPSETLHRGLTRRGYNLSRRRDANENTPEIVKIG